MLDEQSYLMAIYVYLGAAGIMLLYCAWWLARHWQSRWVALVVLVMAALLLTPAYPRAGVDTMAPALIVAVFQVATEGVDSAKHALRPLVFMCGLAVIIALFLSLTLFRKPKSRKPANRKSKPTKKTSSAGRARA